jgi:hypothetical protein
MNKYAQRVQELGGSPHPDTSPVGASEEELAEVERQLGEELPIDYREFLRGFGAYEIDVSFETSRLFSHDYPKYLCEVNNRDRGLGVSLRFDELLIEPKNFGYAASTLWFYGVFHGEVRSSNNVYHRQQGLVENYKYCCRHFEAWPEQWLPVSYHYNPGFVVLTFKGDKKGSVLHISDASMDRIGYVSDSFDEFMQLLRVNDPDEDD